MSEILYMLLGCALGIGLFSVALSVNNMLMSYKTDVDARLDDIHRRITETITLLSDRINKIADKVDY